MQQASNYPVRLPSANDRGRSSTYLQNILEETSEETLDAAVILIAVDATREPNDYCFEWALSNVVKPGDRVIFLGIIHRISTPMGYKSQADFSDFVGTNRHALDSEIRYKLDYFEKKLQRLSDLYDKKGVYLDITITAGNPLKSVLLREASKLHATHVILDRNLRKDKRYYKERLDCAVVTFSQNNQVEYVRGNFQLHSTYNSRGSIDKVKRAVRSIPDSPATTRTFDSDSISWSERSTMTESSASLEYLTSNSEDTEISVLVHTKAFMSTSKEFSSVIPYQTKGADGSGEGSSTVLVPASDADLYQTMDSSESNSPSGENSFIELYVLNSPQGIIPVWSTNDAKDSGRFPATVCSLKYDEEDPQMVTSAKMPSSSLDERDYDIVRTGEQNVPTPSSHLVSMSHSSNKTPKSFEEINSTSIDTRRQHLLLDGLFKVHDFPTIGETCDNEAERKHEKSHLSSYLDSEEVVSSVNAFEMQRNTFETAVQHVYKKQDPWASHVSSYPWNNAMEGMDYIFGKFLAQPPPLCLVCKLKSPKFSMSPIIFHYEQLKAATNDFSTENLIAEGIFSVSYKGILQEGHLVAVKKLRHTNPLVDAHFIAEVEALSCAQHKNLVRLIGYCTESNQHSLVYEYVCNGSLDQHLSGTSTLEWSSRLKIAIGVARGLRYLHEECRAGCIVHGDLRSNNILLTHDFKAMVEDFGLAKLNSNKDVATETQDIGSLGYVAPEYVQCGQITSKMDVYSYGVILLELITGYKAVDFFRPKGKIFLTEWAKPKLDRNQIHKLVDSKIVNSLDMYDLYGMVKAASLCIQRDPLERPGMSQVLRILEGDELQGATFQNLSPIDNSFKHTYQDRAQEDGGSDQKLQMLHSRKALTARV